jgi:hypothetical protein
MIGLGKASRRDAQLTAASARREKIVRRTPPAPEHSDTKGPRVPTNAGTGK